MFFEAEGRRLLLAGDAHARVMVEALRKVAERDGTERVKVDVFKLAHHGSAGNVTRDLLDLVECDRYVVSTNGQYFNHPDVEAVELLGRPGARVPDRLLQLRLGHHPRVDRPRRVPAHRHPGRLRPGWAHHHRGLGRARVGRRDPVPPAGDRRERAHDRPPGSLLTPVPSGGRGGRDEDDRRRLRRVGRRTGHAPRVRRRAGHRHHRRGAGERRRRRRSGCSSRSPTRTSSPARSACPGTDWEERYRRLRATCATRFQPDELGPAPTPEAAFERNNDWLLAVAQSAAPRLRALAVWDRAPGDGPGGTSDFVDRARAMGATVAIIDPADGRLVPDE